jgi:hypothetical protein
MSDWIELVDWLFYVAPSEPGYQSRPQASIMYFTLNNKYIVINLCNQYNISLEVDMTIASGIQIKVADEVWIATALLHREHPDRVDFEIADIMERAAQEAGMQPLRAGVYVHVVQHCVANRPPSPGRYRMIVETMPGRRRLFRNGDSYDPAREGSKTAPAREDIPFEYAGLLDWYRDWNQASVEDRIKNDPLLALYGSGKELWADEHADVYVRRLREGWE